MKYNIRGNKIDVTEAINDYIKSKLSKIEKYLDDNDEVEAKAIISARGKDQKVEVTIWSGKYNIRAEEINPDLYSAIDLVIDKLERQFKKYRGKLNDRKNAREEYVPSIEIEESPLGRFVDIDVYYNSLKSISRDELGFENRKCIYCVWKFGCLFGWGWGDKRLKD